MLAAGLVAGPKAAVRYPAWIPPLIARLGQCETHLRWRTSVWVGRVHYEGFVNWADGTWDADKPAGYPDHAWQATPRQQVRVALNSVRKHRYFGCLHGPEHAWVRG